MTDAAAVPKVGEAYIQFGLRIVIVRVTEVDVMFYCRTKLGSTPPQSVPLAKFLEQVSKGFLTRSHWKHDRARGRRSGRRQVGAA